jgi:hypothetical protein
MTRTDYGQGHKFAPVSASAVDPPATVTGATAAMPNALLVPVPCATTDRIHDDALTDGIRALPAPARAEQSSHLVPA